MCSRRLFVQSIIFGLWLFSSSIYAGAYYVGEIGSRSIARGGANIVNPGNSSAVWLNPGALSQIEHFDVQLNNSLVYFQSKFTRDCGDSQSIVACGPKDIQRQYGEFSYRHRKDRRNVNDNNFYSPNTPDANSLGRKGTPSRFKDGHSVTNQTPFIYIPSLFFAWKLKDFGLDKWTVGGGIWAPHSGDYGFPEDEYSRYILINRDLYQLYYGLSMSYAFNDRFSIGGGIQLVTNGMQQELKVSADRYGNESPNSDIRLKVTALDLLSPTANIGLWSRPFENIQIGGSLQLGQSVQAEGDLEIQEMGDEIKDLMKAEGDSPPILDVVTKDPRVKINFNLPAIYRLGIKYDRSFFENLLAFDLELNFVYEQWSVFDSVKVTSSGTSFSFAGAQPKQIPPVILPKVYQDTFSLRLGSSLYIWDRILQLHSGIFYENAAIPTETLSVDLVNGEKIGIGLGTSVNLYGATLDIAYGHLFIGDRIVGQESIVYVENQTPSGLAGGDLATRASMGQYQMSYDIFSLGLSYAFNFSKIRHYSGFNFCKLEINNHDIHQVHTVYF